MSKTIDKLTSDKETKKLLSSIQELTQKLNEGFDRIEERYKRMERILEAILERTYRRS